MDDWKTRYWGANYDKLLSIKNKYDPDVVFYCYHCVGSDLVTSFSFTRIALTVFQIMLIAGGLGLTMTL